MVAHQGAKETHEGTPCQNPKGTNALTALIQTTAQIKRQEITVPINSIRTIKRNKIRPKPPPRLAVGASEWTPKAPQEFNHTQTRRIQIRISKQGLNLHQRKMKKNPKLIDTYLISPLQELNRRAFPMWTNSDGGYFGEINYSTVQWAVERPTGYSLL